MRSRRLSRVPRRRPELTRITLKQSAKEWRTPQKSFCGVRHLMHHAPQTNPCGVWSYQMLVRYHSSTAQAAYNDLLSLLLDEAVAEIRGSPKLIERSGKG